MKVTETKLPQVLVIEPTVFRDARGYFLETWNQLRYREIGLPTFVQDNLSYSERGTLRGLHFQYPLSQGKLVSVLHGEVFDVAVDIRLGSPTFGRWVGVSLSAANQHQLFIPAGFAHGFCVTSESALFAYKCTEFYSPSSEAGIIWDDPEIGITWPVANPILSDKDRSFQRLVDFPAEALPRFGA